jgi:hypothetical protein
LFGKKTDGLLENLRILRLIFVKNGVKDPFKYHEAAHIVGQLYGVPHGIFKESLTLYLYENEFQNPQIFQQTIKFQVSSFVYSILEVSFYSELS